MAGCPDRARRLLTAAAMLGVRCPLTWAAAVGQVEEPLQALEEASGTKLVDARSDGDGWVVAVRPPAHSLGGV
jgi:hypothetical protein